MLKTNRLVSLFLICCMTSVETNEDVYKQNGVVPDVISTAPKNFLKVSYDSGVEVNLGNTLTPTQVKNAPKVSWDAEPDSLYTLAMTDPDAPSRKDPRFREFEHWLVVNIPGNAVDQGDTIAEYIGSGPPAGTGLHRYVFLVYKQQGRISDSEHGKLGISRENRRNFKISKFAEKHNLGEPIAGNFYQAEFDDYVPELHKKLGAGK